MRKNEKAFWVNVMWVPLFAALMTVALSKAPGVNPYFVGALMGDVPRIELFARQKTPGWDIWGNELENDLELAA